MGKNFSIPVVSLILMTAAVLRMTRVSALADYGEQRWEKAMKEFVVRPDDPVTQVFSTASSRFAAVPPGDG